LLTGIYNITAYGAQPNQSELATPAVQAAIDAAAAVGGGVVLVPPGTYRIGTIFLKSNITLELQAGAVLVGSPNISDYPVRPYGQIWPHDPQTEWYHLIIAENAVDVTLRGPGRIDGNGPAFRHTAAGPRMWMEMIKPRVEAMVHFRNCRNVRVLDVCLDDSPAWNLHFYDCDNVWVRGLQISGALFGPNIDGIDVQGCRDVLISDCQICTGDDAIVCFPSRERDCERVTVTNCSLETNCVPFKAYVVDDRAVRDLTFSNSTIIRSTRGVALYMFNQGVIENVLVSNVVINTESGFWLNRPLQIDARRFDKMVAVPDSAPRGVIRNVQFSNLVIRTDGRIIFTAADDLQAENVVLRDIRIIYPVVEDPKAYGDVRSSQFNLHSPEARAARAAVVVDNVKQLTLENVQVSWPDGNRPEPWRGLLDGQGQPKPYPRLPDADPPAFSVLWARRVRQGYIHNPLARPFLNAPRYDVADCTDLTLDPPR
jgi:polygalacturonase